MKKVLYAAAAVMMCAVILVPSVFAGTTSDKVLAADADDNTASSREEVVYANLTASGAVKDVTVVSILSVSQAGLIKDYGDYSSVKNLTNVEPLSLNGDLVTVSAPVGDFYYQGSLKQSELPWVIDVTYTLDDESLPAEALAGKSGHLELGIAVTANENADSSYFDNYLLQISVSLDASVCKAISAPDGTIANAGNNKMITYTIMPGNSGAFKLETDVNDFAMQGIQFAALPLSLTIPTPDTNGITSDLQSLTDAIAAINDGMAQLHVGSYDMKIGARDLANGSSEFYSGLKALSSNATPLLDGSSQIKQALEMLASSMSGSSGSLDMSSLAQLPAGLTQMAAGLSDMSAGLSDLKNGFAEAYGALQAAIASIPDTAISDAAINSLYMDNPDKKDTIDALVAYYQAGAQTKATYQAIKPAFDAMDTSLEAIISAADSMAQSLTTTADQLNGALSANDTAQKLFQLSEGLQVLSDNYAAFHENLSAYTSGVTSVSSNYSAINSGLSGLSNGISDLNNGIGDLYDGTAELSNATVSLPEQLNDEVKNMLMGYDKSDFQPVSFVSPKNTDTTSVQFIFITDKIEKAAQVSQEPETVQAETFWTRFLALFK